MEISNHADSRTRAISEDLLTRLEGLQTHLEANIIGQQEIIPTIVETIKNGELGFTERGEPRAAFLMLGPTGVGKTEVTVQFTEYLYGHGKMIRLDMSEFQNQESVAVLIGRPSEDTKVSRGILGCYYDQVGGQGTLLFDEIEKAHRLIMDLFLQILDAGRVSLASGETLDLTRMYIVATSNIGGKMLMHSRTNNRETIVRRVEDEAKGQMRPEIFARFNPVLVFNRLDFEAQTRIAHVHIRKAIAHMAKLGHHLTYKEDILGPIVDRGYTEHLGARPMRNAARAAIREAVRDAIFARESGSGRICYEPVRQRFYLASDEEARVATDEAAAAAME